jgi:transposase
VLRIFQTLSLGTWVNKGRETLLTRRLCPRRSRPRDGPDAIVVRYSPGSWGVLGTGSSWRDLPEEEVGPWLTVYGRYRRGQEEDLWQRIMEALRHRR